MESEIKVAVIEERITTIQQDLAEIKTGMKEHNESDIQNFREIHEKLDAIALKINTIYVFSGAIAFVLGLLGTWVKDITFGKG